MSHKRRDKHVSSLSLKRNNNNNNNNINEQGEYFERRLNDINNILSDTNKNIHQLDAHILKKNSRRYRNKSKQSTTSSSKRRSISNGNRNGNQLDVSEEYNNDVDDNLETHKDRKSRKHFDRPSSQIGHSRVHGDGKKTIRRRSMSDESFYIENPNESLHILHQTVRDISLEQERLGEQLYNDQLCCSCRTGEFCCEKDDASSSSLSNKSRTKKATNYIEQTSTDLDSSVSNNN
jgi:hypothetical protein